MTNDQDRPETENENENKHTEKETPMEYVTRRLREKGSEEININPPKEWFQVIFKR